MLRTALLAGSRCDTAPLPHNAVVAADEPWPLGHNWVPPAACPCTKELLCDNDYRMWEFVREPTGRNCSLLLHCMDENEIDSRS